MRCFVISIVSEGLVLRVMVFPVSDFTWICIVPSGIFSFFTTFHAQNSRVYAWVCGPPPPPQSRSLPRKSRRARQASRPCKGDPHTLYSHSRETLFDARDHSFRG